MMENNDIINAQEQATQLIVIYIKRKPFYIMKVIYNSVIKPKYTLKSVRSVQ